MIFCEAATLKSPPCNDCCPDVTHLFDDPVWTRELWNFSFLSALRLAGEALIHTWARQTCVIRWEWAQGRWTLKQEGADKPQPLIPQFTCMFVAPVTDPGSGWPISSWQEESCTFHSEEAFADAVRGEKQGVRKTVLTLERKKAMNKRGSKHWMHSLFFCKEVI